MRIRFGFITFIAFTLLFASLPKKILSSSPPSLPETLYMKVTFYDFHSDSSNPEFEIAPDTARRRFDMVRETLDDEGKPVLGSEPYFNRRIDRWFRPWVEGDFEIYNYKDIYPERYTRYDAYDPGRVTIAHDTSFKNIVIEDSLLFILVDQNNGTYQFEDSAFFPLDGRGFGNEGRSHNYSFAMEMHYPFTKVPGLSFEFTGDDDVWAFVDSTLRMDIGGIHRPVSDAFELDREPDLVDRQSYSLDFFYVERHVTGSSIKITTNILSPPVKFEIDVYPNDTICALTEISLTADVSDNFFGDRPDLAQNAIWRVLDFDGQDSSALKQNLGQTVGFEANVAYSDVVIEAAVPHDGDTLKDTISLYIKPCDAYQISIEASPVSVNSDISILRSAQPIGEISILSDMTSNDGYAVARDISGAFVRMADEVTTTWNITPDGTSFASAAGEDGRKYHGVVTRLGQEGNTFVVASEPNLISDTATVVIASYYIVRYQLRDSTTGEIIHSITLNTDQSRAYQTWGLKSTATDTTAEDAWILYSAQWTLVSDSIEVNVPTPEKASHWLLDPTKPGSGTLQINNPDDSKTEQLAIPVLITIAEPSFVGITLLTQQSERRAGDTLDFRVWIENGDGLVPGTFCFGNGGDDPSTVSYSDNLGLGGIKPSPTITINGNDSLLNILNQQVHKYNQCFTEGVDTVKVVLYYAPFITDSLHQLTVTLNPQLNAKSEKFRLLPNQLDSIAIEDRNFTPLGPQTLTGNESVTPYSDGYDEWGNRIGFIESDWATDPSGTLDPYYVRGKSSYISAEGVMSDQQGYLCATEKRDSDGKEIEACILITIIGPKKQVTSAVTRDSDGNGYLDGILIVFDRRVEPQQISMQNFVNISNGSVRFIPTGITQIDTATYLLSLQEQSTKQLQTSWRPYFDITGSSAVGDTTQIVTTDGAGPVIAEIIKDVKSKRVKVVLSERVRNVTGNDMQVTDSPALTFNIYRKNRDGTFQEINLLDSITNFTPPITGDSIFYFDQYTDYDISPSHYVNLEVNPPVVQDYVFNTPHIDNRKVKVELVGQIEDMLLAPNPTGPSFLHTGPGSLALNSSQQHIDWAKDKQGAVIKVTLTPDSLMSVTIKIYDMVGNLVAWAHQSDFLSYLKATNSLNDQVDTTNNATGENASVYVLYHYWNGSNQKGMKVAPGLYRIVYYVDYKNSALSDFKLVEVLGISK